MSIKKITVIVPRLPPSIDGLGDYALILAREIQKNFGIITEFVVADPAWIGEVSIENFSVKKVRDRSAAALAELLPKNAHVLLHYVGYGYAKRGCPVWLVKALNSWKVESTNNKLITMFHELYAFGPIWNSQFWTSPLQRMLASQLVNLSDNLLTSKNSYAQILKRFSRKVDLNIPVIPVISNVGEPQIILPLAKRNRSLVVFGGAAWRSKVYRDSKDELEKICHELAIEEIFDIGVPLNFNSDRVVGTPVRSLGILPAEEISRILSHSLAGFFNYPTGYLSKSGIFAAYCSHGVLPVGVYYPKQITDGVEENKHYFLVDKNRAKITSTEAQRIADTANQWYQTHKLSVQAKLFIELLR